MQAQHGYSFNVRCYSFHEEVREGLTIYRYGVQRVASFQDKQPAVLTDEMEAFIKSLPPDPRALVLKRTTVTIDRTNPARNITLGKPTRAIDKPILLYVGTPSGLRGNVQWRPRFGVWKVNAAISQFDDLKALELWLLMWPAGEVLIERSGELDEGYARNFRLRWDGKALFTERWFVEKNGRRGSIPPRARP